MKKMLKVRAFHACFKIMLVKYNFFYVSSDLPKKSEIWPFIGQVKMESSSSTYFLPNLFQKMPYIKHMVENVGQ